MTQGPPPPPTGPPPPTTRGRTVLLAVVAGLVVGLAAGIGVAFSLGGGSGDDDVDLACAALEDVTADDLFDESGIDGEFYRVSGASELFLAAGDGDPESETGRLGSALREGYQRLDQEQTAQAFDDAQAFCDDR